MTRRRELVQPRLVAEGRRDRVLPGPARRGRPVPRRRSPARRPTWTAGEPIALTISAGLDGSVPPGVVHPGRPAAAAADAHARRQPPAPSGAAPDGGAVSEAATTTYLERLARAGARPRAPSCASASIPDPAALPAGLLAGRRRASSGSPTLLLEAALPFAAAVKPNLAFFEAFGSAGWAALERLRARIPADVPVIADAKRGGHRHRRRRARSSRTSTALGVDAVTISPYLGEEAIAAYLERPDRFAYVLCRTSNAGARRAPGPARARASWDADGAFTAPGRAALGAGRARRRRAGGRAARSGSSSARRRPRSCAPRGRSRPALAFLVPGVGAQGGSDRRRCSPRGPATAPPAGGRPGGGLRRQRVARDRRRRPSANGAAGRPGRSRGAARRGRPNLVREAPCATVAAASRPRGRALQDLTCRSNIGPGELILILIIALVVLGPGKLPDVAAIARQERARVPEGRDGRRRRPASSTPPPPTTPRRAARARGARRRPAAATRRQPPRRPADAAAATDGSARPSPRRGRSQPLLARAPRTRAGPPTCPMTAAVAARPTPRAMASCPSPATWRSSGTG